jgi:hypothetical protein
MRDRYNTRAAGTEPRAHTMKRLAAELNLQFQPTDEWGLRRQLSDFRLFRRGMSRRITNHLRSRDAMLETDFHLFDYRFKVSTGKSSKTYNQTVFFVDSRRLALPDFTMKPENILHYIGDLLGFKDIDFEEYPKFSRNYYLKGDDEDYIRASLPHSFLRFFSQEKNWYMEAINYYLIFYRTDHQIPGAELRDFYRKGVKVFGMLSGPKE